MILKNSIRNLLRARGKTALFFTLIFILTLLVGLDCYVYSTVTGYLRACDDTYMTVGLFEYVGADYPDERVYDANASLAAEKLRHSALAQQDCVQLWDAPGRAIGYTEGFARTDTGVYNRNRAVLVIHASHLQDSGLYWCTITETLYSFLDRTGIMLHVDADGLAQLENGHYYLVSGEFFEGPSAYKYFVLAPFQSKAAAGRDPVCLDITDPAAASGYSLPEGTVFSDIATVERVLNNSLDVFSTGNLGAQIPFHQNQVTLTDGRVFSEEEYAASAKVCIVSEALMQQLGLSLGDALPLSLLRAEGVAACESFWPDTGFASTADYTVVGVISTPKAMQHCVYVPAGADPVFDGNVVGYTVATVLLKNGTADRFYRDAQAFLPDRVRLTIYDQGYASAAKPFTEILRVTGIVSAVCALAGICILVLFGYLFVCRQRDVSVTMLRLGTGKRRVCAYFLFGSGLLALISASLGALLGWLFSGRMGALVSRIAASVSLSDTRYSNAALSITKSIEFSPTAQAGPFLAAALAVFLLAALSCLLFTIGTFRVKRVRRQRRALSEKAERPYTPRGGKMKYAWLSIARGGARTVIAPMTALLAAIFLCQLTASSAAYQAEYEQLCTDTSIKGYITDSHGRTTNRLTIPALVPNALLRAGFVEDMTVSRTAPYLYQGVFISDGIEQALAPIDFPESDYGYETFMDRVKAGPTVIFTNSLERAPEFRFSSFVDTAFLEGFDSSVLAAEIDPSLPMPCLLSTSFMAENGVKLGDTVSVWVLFNERLWQNDMLVVGSYRKANVKENIYCPLSGYVENSVLMAEEDDPTYRKLPQYAFESADFTLSDASRLGDFKAYLSSCGYSCVEWHNTKRVFVVMDDRSFYDMAETLSRQIRNVGTLYPILYALTGAAGLVAAYLLLLNRKREYAIMRVLGTPPRRAFFSLFSEQLLLCLPGAALGLGTAALAGTFNKAGALLAAGFALCWLVGGAAALIRMNGRAVLATLHEEE